MTLNSKGHIVPDAYTTCVLLITFDKEDHRLKVILSKRSEFDKMGNCDPFNGKWSIPEHYVKYGVMANQTANQIVSNQVGIDPSNMFLRHIGVFDNPNRDTRGWYITNVFYALVSSEAIQTISKDCVILDKNFVLENENNIAFDHKSIILKILENVENDIYTQIFNKTLFDTDAISALLGNTFTAKDLQSLGNYVGLNYDRATYYRNINKFYQKIGQVKIDGIKKPVALYKKEKNEKN